MGVEKRVDGSIDNLFKSLKGEDRSKVKFSLQDEGKIVFACLKAAEKESVEKVRLKIQERGALGR